MELKDSDQATLEAVQLKPETSEALLADLIVDLASVELAYVGGGAAIVCFA
jgi:hypothetical protein